MRGGSRIFVVGLVAVVGLALLPAAGASADTGTISGVLTDSVTNAPIADACAVRIWDSTKASAQNACTDDNGGWSMDGLDTTATWYVEAKADGYLDQWAFGTDQAGAAAITAPATVDLALDPQTRLSGTLKRSDGTVPTDGSVQIVKLNDDDQDSVSVDSSGAWSVQVPAGSYRILYFGDDLSFYAPAAVDESDAQTYSVTAQHDTVVDLTMPAPTGVSGTITSAATGLPVKGICVNVEPAKNPQDGPGGSACSNSAGHYKALLEEGGTYRVSFADSKGAYAAQYYPHSATPTASTVLTIPGGVLRTDVDASLRKASVLTGRALDSVTHKPLKNACAAANFGRTSTYAEGQTEHCSGTGGHFAITGLAATSYAVDVTVGFRSVWAPGTSHAKAKVFKVGVGATKSVGNVLVPPGGKLTGVVKDAKTGKPLKGVWVSVGYSPRAGDPESPYTGRTDKHGRYSISHVKAGKRQFVAWTLSSMTYAPSFGGSPSASKGKKVTIHNAKTAHENFALVHSATVKGTLLDGAGHKVTGYHLLDALTATGTAFRVGVSSDVRSGVFSVKGLPATPIVLAFFSDTSDKIIYYYNGATTRKKAKVLHPKAGKTITVTAHVPAG